MVRLPTREEHLDLLRHLSHYLARHLAGGERQGALAPLAGWEGLGCFVTLRRAIDGELRGCIGVTRPGAEKLLTLAERMAISAARDDPRFPAVTRAELSELTLGVSLLTPEVTWPHPRDPSRLRLGEEGLRVRKEGATGVLLPQVALAWGFDAAGFLDATCQKAGLPIGSWQDSDVEVFRFEGREVTAPVAELWTEIPVDPPS